jgi:TonB family protein
VDLRIDRRGHVLDAKVASASDPAFGAAALDAVRQWRFVPEVRNGRAVPSDVTLPFVFNSPL